MIAGGKRDWAAVGWRHASLYHAAQSGDSLLPECRCASEFGRADSGTPQTGAVAVGSWPTRVGGRHLAAERDAVGALAGMRCPHLLATRPTRDYRWGDVVAKNSLTNGLPANTRQFDGVWNGLVGALEEIGMLEEFKKFALRGNVVDLAVGVIIGVAFGAIVASLVGDIIMPVIGAVTGGLEFSNYFIPLSRSVTATAYVDAKKQGAVLGYGQFLTVVLNFVIVAFVLFVAIRSINKLQKPPEAKPAELPADVRLLAEIRDILAARSP